MNFPEKKSVRKNRKNILIIYLRAKNQKKTNIQVLRKMLNCWMDGQIDKGQTDNHDSVGPSVGRGSN